MFKKTQSWEKFVLVFCFQDYINMGRFQCVCVYIYRRYRVEKCG